MFVLSWFLMQASWAASPDVVAQVVAGVASYRQMRTTKGAPSVSTAEIKKAASGNVVTGISEVPGTKHNKVYAVAVVDIPISRFWAGLNDETRHPGYTAVAYSELLKGRVCQSGRRVLQYLPVPVPFVPDRWWIGVITMNHAIMRQSGGSVRELSWHSSVDKSEITSASGKKIIAGGSPIAKSQGGWFLVAIDARTTYVEYYSWNDPGGKIPAGVAAMFASKGVRQNIAAITRFTKEGSPSCPVL